jgi:4-hydroxybenzoate polyprenyltransferase
MSRQPRDAAPVRSASAWRLLRGVIVASHPFPIAMVMSLTLLLALASGGGRETSRLLAALAAMLTSQLAIGWSNDYLDRERDARFQPGKPVPSGAVPAQALLALAPASLALSGLIGAALGPATLAWLAAGTACGLAYNLFFKETRLSWLPYVLAFAVLPPFVWGATGSFRGQYLWLYPVGAPLAVGAHIANTLPDFEADAAAGSRRLIVRLGRPRALAALFACLLLPLGGAGVASAWLDYSPGRIAAVVAAYGLLVLATAAAYRAGRAAAGFRLAAPASVLFAAGWLWALR